MLRTGSAIRSAGSFSSTSSRSIVRANSRASLNRAAPGKWLSSRSARSSSINLANSSHRRVGSMAGGMSLAPSGSSSAPKASSRSRSPIATMRGISIPGRPASPACLMKASEMVRAALELGTSKVRRASPISSSPYRGTRPATSASANPRCAAME